MNILMAWELGAGLGHTVPLAAIGAYFVDRCHSVSYALRNPKTAEIANIAPDSDICAAPVMGISNPGHQAAFDCAEMLLIRGFERAERLDRRLDAWLRIFERFSPDLIVTDHAPSARLAAHIAQIPSHTVGDGFAIPPVTSPLQPFLQSPDVRITEQDAFESRLNAATNAALKRYGRTEVERAVEIYFGGSVFLRVFEEMDHYENRPGATYHGPILHDLMGVSPQWPTTAEKRVFMYLYADSPALPKLLAALDHMGVSTIVYTGVKSDRSQRGFSVAENVVFSEHPIRMNELSADCDLFICHGGSAAAAALLRGIPVLCLPRHIEQKMTSLRLKGQGLGEILIGNLDQDTVTLTISNCLKSDALRGRAIEFARRYQHFDGSRATKTIAEKILHGG